jgi:hypothetical protein
MVMPAKNVTGLRSGKLVAMKIVGKRGKQNLWECACDCGSITTAIATQIAKGTKTSCGCKRKEPRKPRPDLVKRNKENAIHGQTNSRTYSSWRALKFRCENKDNKDYPNYGGRGIKVCDQWSKSFSEFLRDMGERPEGTSIDRIDPDGNYEPGNCRWASNKKQSNNKRCNVFVEYEGKTMTVTEWAKEYGLEVKTLLYRVKIGWDIETALTTPSTIKRK